MRYFNSANLRVIQHCIREPSNVLRFIRKGFPPVDPVASAQLSWVHGALPSVPLRTLLPQSSQVELRLINAFDRRFTTSITVEELSCLLAIAKGVAAAKILEIGTWDGNTTLNLAANTEAAVVTLDLPPNFDVEQHQDSLAYPTERLNLTRRTDLGRQFEAHPLKSRIHQVYGDSAQIDWGSLGGPFDLVFIDGCHEYPYVKADTNNALAHLRKGGAIVWHGYRMLGSVSRAVDEFANGTHDFRVNAIEGTRLAVAFG